MKTASEKRVFTMLEGERPLLAFEAHTFREAQSLCKEEWLRDELRGHGWDGTSKLTVRQAEDSEVSRFREEAGRAKASPLEDPDDLVLAYLVAQD
jgi:hypothetical protein